MKIRATDIGLAAYADAWRAMRRFTDARGAAAQDELWLVQHPPVFTLGRAGREGHILRPGTIPIVRSDRGGQVTYHGPGQLVVYTLLDIKRLNIGPRELVRRIEGGIIDYLHAVGIVGQRRQGAPGVYVDSAKIAALGLRIKNGRSYHGFALNVAMDLEPFSRIDPCGYAGLQVTQLTDLGIDADCAAVSRRLIPEVVASLYPGAEAELEFRRCAVDGLSLADDHADAMPE